jgi:hypothetical protein
MADYTIPTSPLKRLRYYNNQFLAEKDFIDDQAAHLAHERAYLRALCTPGVWEGLIVNYGTLPTTSAPAVGIGIAVDNQGRLIVLDPTASGPAPATLGTGTFVLSIRYNEVATDMSTNTGGAAGTADNTRFTSQPVLAATAPNAVPAGAVVLGTFTVSGGQITARSDAGRQYAGLRLPGPVLAGSPPPATLASRNDGVADSVQLNGALFIQRPNGGVLGLMLPGTSPGTSGTGCSISFDPFDAGINSNAITIRSVADGNFSSHLTVSTKVPGAINNGQVERMRITSGGAAQFSGALSAQSLAAATYGGAVNFTGAVTTSNQVVSGNTAETNVAPLVLNRDYLGNNRSLIDHNGYRMGEVSEIDENWKLGNVRSVLFQAVPVDFGGGALPGGGTGTFGSGYRIATAAAQADSPIGPLPAGATIVSAVVQYERIDGTADYAINDHASNVSTTVVRKSISTGTGVTTTDLAATPTAGGLPYTVGPLSNLTLNVQGGPFTGGHRVFGVQISYIVDPPGWTWSGAISFGVAQFTRSPSRKYQDPAAALGLGQRSINIASPFGGAGPGDEGTLTTEGHEAFMDANTCYVMEWICRTGTISDAVNVRSFKLGVQNANGGANNRFIYFFNQNTTANWQLRIVGSSTADTDTGVAIAANTIYRMRLEILGSNMSSSGANAFRIRGFINGSKVADVVSATLPTADMCRPFFAAGVTATGSVAYDFSLGRVRRVWNHRASSDSL